MDYDLWRGAEPKDLRVLSEQVPPAEDVAFLSVASQPLILNGRLFLQLLFGRHPPGISRIHVIHHQKRGKGACWNRLPLVLENMLSLSFASQVTPMKPFWSGLIDIQVSGIRCFLSKALLLLQTEGDLPGLALNRLVGPAFP
jgi:hypothetical protein